jgi:hypothetical protein
MFPLQTRYAVKIVKERESCPWKVSELHQLRPDVSWAESPHAIETSEFVIIVSVPPAWKGSLSGIGSVVWDGELKSVLC